MHAWIDQGLLSFARRTQLTFHDNLMALIKVSIKPNYELIQTLWYAHYFVVKDVLTQKCHFSSFSLIFALSTNIHGSFLLFLIQSVLSPYSVCLWSSFILLYLYLYIWHSNIWLVKRVWNSFVIEEQRREKENIDEKTGHTE